MSDEQQIVEAAQNAKAPGTFNIVSVLQERAYPQATVRVLLDESLAYEASLIKEEMDALDNKIGDKKMSQSQLAKHEDLLAKRDELNEKILASAYTVHVRGISEGKREELYREACKKYPIQYESSNNIAEILGGQAQRIEKQSPERDALFTDYLWQYHIAKIVSPDGDEQTDFSYSTIKVMRESFPLSAIMKVNEAIEKIRASTAIFMMETGEDFLAKP